MKIISLDALQQDSTRYAEIKSVLQEEGLISFPSISGYKLGAALHSPAAITSVLQAKRRIKNAPALVFVPDEKWAAKLATTVSDQAKSLMKAFWPGPMTLLFQPSDELHPKVRKPLTKAKGWLGIRLPDDEIPLAVVRAFGEPLLVSSANLANKHGARSLAQVKKNFGRTLDLLIDAGDLTEGPKSTLVDATCSQATVVRAGAISEEEIHRALEG